MVEKHSNGFNYARDYNIDNHNKNVAWKNGHIFTELAIAADQKEIAKCDYEGQIQKWNAYQNLLDKVDEKCTKTNGDVILKRNIKHNVRILHDTEVALLSTFGLIALLILSGGSIEHNIYAIIGSLTALAIVGWQAFIRLHPPEIIKFTCRPELHIEEYAYMNKAIKGIPKVQRDPVVKLPPIEMSIQRSWLAQQGMLSFMESLEEIKMDGYLTGRGS